MAIAVGLMILASVCTQQVTAKCDEEVVNKIKALNVDNTNLMENMLGDYKVVSLGISILVESPPSDKVCATLSFLKVDGTYKVDYKKMNLGVHDLVQEGDGVFEHNGDGNEPDIIYYPVHSTHDTLALYVCADDDEADGPELWYVLVPVKDTDYAKQTEDATEKFKKVGLQAWQTATNFPACKKVTTLAEADKTFENLLKPDETETDVTPEGTEK